MAFREKENGAQSRIFSSSSRVGQRDEVRYVKCIADMKVQVSEVAR